MSTCIVMVDGLEELVENSVEDIEKQLSENGVAKLNLSNSDAELSVAKNFIISYYPTD